MRIHPSSRSWNIKYQYFISTIKNERNHWRFRATKDYIIHRRFRVRLFASRFTRRVRRIIVHLRPSVTIRFPECRPFSFPFCTDRPQPTRWIENEKINKTCITCAPFDYDALYRELIIFENYNYSLWVETLKLIFKSESRIASRGRKGWNDFLEWQFCYCITCVFC